MLKRFFSTAIVTCVMSLCFDAMATLNVNASSPANAKSGEAVKVIASVAGGADCVKLHFSVDSVPRWNSSIMAWSSIDNAYIGYLPAIDFGEIAWKVTASKGSDSGTTSQKNVVIEDAPSYNFLHDMIFNSSAESAWEAASDVIWTAPTPNGSEWSAEYVKFAEKSSLGLKLLPTSMTEQYPVAYFPNYNTDIFTPFIRSPMMEAGVGAVDFISRLDQAVTESKLVLEVSYDNNGNGWKEIAEWNYGTDYYGADYAQVVTNHVVLNDEKITYVRIRRTQNNKNSSSLIQGTITIDDFCVAPIASDVTMRESLMNPGYPANGDNIKIRCIVGDKRLSSPAYNRDVKVYYQHTIYENEDLLSPDGWQVATMSALDKLPASVSLGAGEQFFEAILPKVATGVLWYYFECDFDGYAYREEDANNPRYLGGAGIEGEVPTSYFRKTIRPYHSRYSSVVLEAQDDAVSTKMTLVGDESWQSLVPLEGISAITNVFLCYGYYEDDAVSFVPSPVVLGEKDAQNGHPASFGSLEVIGADEFEKYGLLAIDLDSSDNLIYRIKTDGDRGYSIKHAVYQDFNTWQADTDKYATSIGLSATLNESTSFDDWNIDCTYSPTETAIEDFEAEKVSADNSFISDRFITALGFQVEDFYVSQDRRKDATISSEKINRTITLRESGAIETTKDSITYGIDSVSFNAHTSFRDKDTTFTLYKSGIGASTNYFVQADVTFSDAAPSKHYFSYVCNYFSDWDGIRYYELRFIHTNVQQNQDDRVLAINLIRHNPDGSEELVSQGFSPYFRDIDLKTLSTDIWNRAVRFKFTTFLGSKGQVKITYSIGSTTSSSVYVTDTISVGDPTPAFRDLSGSYGTFGFGAFDVVPEITAIKAGTSESSSTSFVGSLASSYGHFHNGGYMQDGTGRMRWDVTANHIKRNVPQQTVLVQTSPFDGNATAFPGTYKDVVTNVVSSTASTLYTTPVHCAKRVFTRVCYLLGEGELTLDNFTTTPHLAWSFIDGNFAADVGGVPYREWPNTEYQDEWYSSDGCEGFLVLQGSHENKRASDMQVVFDRSRADTNLVQALVCPFMENGIGSIRFDYRVLKGEAVFAVEHSMTNDQLNVWTLSACFTNKVGDIGTYSVTVGEAGYGARFRIRILGDLNQGITDNPGELTVGASSDDAIVAFDNVTVWDYPPRDDSAWSVYNARITDDFGQDDIKRIYEGIGKSCALNNSNNRDTSLDVLGDHKPFIQTPAIPQGIGEISFHYRFLDKNAKNSTLVLRAAPAECFDDAFDLPDEDPNWSFVASIEVQPGDDYVTFELPEYYNDKDNILRIYSSTNDTTQRILIDNILVCEPVRAGFDIMEVKMVPEQPIAGEPAYVSATLGEFKLVPSNICVYCSYYVGTDTWGVANWFDSTHILGKKDTVQLKQIGSSNTYESDWPVPTTAIDDVVQYVVWATHADIDLVNSKPIMQDANNFVNPTYYEPVDLNLQFAEEYEGARSPYYFVFSCAPDSIWVNEVFHYRGTKDKGKPEYVEICGPEGASIANWKFSIVNVASKGKEIFADFAPDGATFASGADSGKAFFVYGDDFTSEEYPYYHGPDLAMTDSSTASTGQLKTDYGIILYRSMGAIVLKAGWADDDTYTKKYNYDYVGKRKAGSESLSAVNKVVDVPATVYADLCWTTNSPCSPGTINENEYFGGIVASMRTFSTSKVDKPCPPEWLKKWGTLATDPDNLSLYDEYLLGTNPTANTEVDFKILSIDFPEEDVVSITTKLIRKEGGATISEPINGEFVILAYDNFNSEPAEYATTAKFTGKEIETVRLNIKDARLKFFRAAIIQ